MSNYPGMPMQYQRAMNRMAAYNLRRPAQQEHNLGHAVGGAIGVGLAKREPAKTVAKPTHGPEMYDKYVQGTGASVGMAQTGQLYVDNQAVLDNADKAVQVNQMAEDARIGGKFTPSGLEKAGKVADANGADRYQLKRMVGLAGTQVPGVTVAPRMGPGMGPGAH